MISMSIDSPERGTVKIDGEHVNVFRQSLQRRHFPEQAIDSIISNGFEILSQCPNSSSPDGTHSVGIMIGKVQSGKTSNFIGLTALALDNEYNVVVILGGTKGNLVTQNKVRIEEYLVKDREKPNPLVIAIGAKRENPDSFNVNSEFLNDQARFEKKVVLVVLKRANNIEVVSQALKSYNPENGPVLIIDDEGDEASLNTNAFKKINKAFSSTYESIVNLIESPCKSAFITVTATPQANFLIRNGDRLSPEFGVLVQPGDGYCGLSVFHGTNMDRYYREISDRDSEIMEDLTSGFPESFRRAFAMFFVGAAIRNYRGDADKHAMLIHTSSSKDSHTKVANAVKTLFENWKDLVSMEEESIPDDSYQKLDILFREAYSDLKTTSNNAPNFEELKPYIWSAFKRCNRKILICNGDVDDSNLQQYYNLNIFVGGNKLQRGITIDGLSITYMTRRAQKKTTVDTTEQRARWLGYRRKHLDVCRVFTTKQIANDYASILEHEDEFWNHISQWLNEGYGFKEIPRIMVLASNKLNFTRTNVARSEKLDEFDWIIQNVVVLDQKQSEENVRLANDYCEKKHTDYVNWGTIKHYVAYDLPFMQVISELLNRLNLPETEGFTHKSLNILKTLLNYSGEQVLCDVFWVRKDKPQARSIDEKTENKIKALMSGSSEVYPGDKGFVGEVGNYRNVKVQIHYLRPKKSDNSIEYPVTTAVAIRFPACVLESFEEQHIHIRAGDLDGN